VRNAYLYTHKGVLTVPLISVRSGVCVTFLHSDFFTPSSRRAWRRKRDHAKTTGATGRYAAKATYKRKPKYGLIEEFD
jgi:hypothetical protein